jgi:hypothetical protein
MVKDPRPRGPSPREGREHAGADADGRVDVETAQRMVQAAVLDAVQREDKAASIVQQKTTAASRRAARINLVLGLGISAALVAAAAAALAMYRSRKAADALSSEIGLGGSARRPTGAIPTTVLTGRAIFEQNKAAVYVMGYLLGNRVGGCCSAFAIGPSLLATNAHCVLSCKSRGGTPIVTQNDSGGKTRFRIVAMTTHPAYRDGSSGADSPDVGLLRIDGKAATTVVVASDAELRSIGPGDDAYVIGFPGRVMDPLSPSATFLQGRIGRVTGMSEQPASPDQAVLIQHDAVTRGGNSGSPIFNQYGHVIGVHAAHIDEEEDVSIGGKKTKVVTSSPFRLGMRIDLLSGVPQP